MIRIKSICILLLISFLNVYAFDANNESQTLALSNKKPTPIQALNNYVHFINESVHGMVIVHRLLENYNQELNKYVDLDGYQINNFGNSDLPKNIFKDPDDWFYKISPWEWYDICKDGSTVLRPKDATSLNNLMEGLRQKLTRINQIRFDIDQFIASKDLTKQEHIEKVYSFLEEGTNLYDKFYDQQTKLEVVLIKLSREYGSVGQESAALVKVMDTNWSASKNILRSVRNKKEEVLPGQISKLKRELNALKAIDIKGHEVASLKTPKSLRSWNRIITKLEELNSQTISLVETADVPKEYKYYGKFYYYHNAVLVNQINRYGSGFATEMNNIIKTLDLSVLMKTEEPHFYQVIYPKKLIKDDVIESSDDLIAVIPKKLKDREIISSTRKIIVDTTVFEINLYDYKLQDGDIVSINFNGDWILENYSLEGAPTKIKVKMNPEGKNYLLLHAINEGRNPPNTMGLSYKYKGETQKITLSSNLAESELIEIIYDGGAE